MRISTLSQNLRIDNSITSIQRQIADAQLQVSTGKRSQVYSGFEGQDTRLLITLKEQRTTVDSYLSTIDNTRVKTSTIDAVLVQTTEIVEDLRTKLSEQVEGLFEESSLALATFSNAAIDQIVNLINQTSDGKYLFNGADTDTQPLNDAATAKGTYAQPALSGGAAAIQTAAQNFFAVDANWTNVSTPVPDNLTARIDEGVDVTFGEFANNDAFEEVFETLYAFANINFADGDDAEYRNMVNWGINKIEGALDQINNMVGQNGVIAGQMEDRKEAHKDTISLLKQQIIDIEDVDSYDAVVEFLTLQAQLEASYRTTSVLRGLSLTQFL